MTSELPIQASSSMFSLCGTETENSNQHIVGVQENWRGGRAVTNSTGKGIGSFQ